MMSEYGIGKHMYGCHEVGPQVHRLVTVRPDRLLNDMGCLVEDYGDEKGWDLLWNLFFALKHLGFICEPALVMAKGHKVRGDTSIRRLGYLSVSGLGLIEAFEAWMDSVNLTVKGLADVQSCISDVFEYFHQQKLLDKTVVAFGFFREPPGLVTQFYYPYMEVPTHKWYPSFEGE